MKIVFVIDTMSKGGAERVVANLTSYLSKNNDVDIITVYNTNVAYELNENVKVYHLDDFETDIFNKKHSNMVQKLTKNFKRVRTMKKYKKELKPDVMVSFLPLANFITLAANKKQKVKTIISVRTDPKVEYASKGYKTIMKWLYPKTDGIVFQTEDAKNYFKESIKSKGKIIPNPINENFIGKPYDGIREKQIVTVGRVEEAKNHKLLIDAFAKIANKYPDYQLVIYGDGVLRDELKRHVKDIDLSSRVLLPGKIDNVKETIRDAKMFVLSSIYEGMPNALMEAMALGLPVISTDCPCGGPKFLIENNVNGILIENRNEEELVSAMEKIIEDEEFAKMIGDNANKICETLNPEKINKIWEGYIDEIYKK